MANLAAELDRALAERKRRGAPVGTTWRTLAEGPGWTVADVICTSGPRDRPFEERHPEVAVAIVAAGTFQYRSAAGRALMTPGSLLLGNAEQEFECSHDHGPGDRCLSFQFTPEYFEGLCADAGLAPRFQLHRLPPARVLSPVVARALTGLAAGSPVSWEEMGVQLVGAAAAALGSGARGNGAPAPSAVARIARVVREIERAPEDEHALGTLAREAGLSPYHFLRTFLSVTGVTPHQFVLRARLRQAALRLADHRGRVLDIALDSGFGDVSSFNRAFRAEFGMSPRAFRRGGTIPAHVR